MILSFQDKRVLKMEKCVCETLMAAINKVTTVLLAIEYRLWSESHDVDVTGKGLISKLCMPNMNIIFMVQSLWRLLKAFCNSQTDKLNTITPDFQSKGIKILLSNVHCQHVKRYDHDKCLPFLILRQ